MKRLIENIRTNSRINGFLKQNRDMLIKAAAALCVVVAAFFVFIAGGDDGEIVVEEVPAAAAAETVEPDMDICVDVGGQVKNPTVVELPEGSRVQDAIDAAGGLTEEADLTEINRAAIVEDGEKIFIPASSGDVEEDSDESSKGSTSAAVWSDGRININTADSEQLQELDGIGPATAEKIIDYREENGRFASVEDIKKVSGIGEKTYEALKDSIKV